MDHPLLRTAIRSLLSEMSHYSPVKAATAAQFPHMAKGHDSTWEEALSEALEACRSLGDRPLLYRGHAFKGKSSGVVIVKSDPEGWRRGRMGLTMSISPVYAEFMEELTGTLGMANVVYTSFGAGRSTFGSPSLFVPLSPAKVAYNPEVYDLYIDWKKHAEGEGRGADEMIEGYVEGWPTDLPRGTEVLVDCDRYALLSSEILKHTLFYRDKEGQAALDRVKTYSDLADVISPET